MAAEIAAQHKKEKLESKLKLDTKGCCFLCLTVVNLKTEVRAERESDKDGDGNKESTASKSKLVSLRTLNRYLNINLDKLRPTCSSSVLMKDKSAKLNDDTKVDLCETCGRILDKFSKLFLSWEKIQLEMDFWQGRIHQQISKGSQVPELVQNYSKRMTSDPETLTQLVFVDKLRKEISKRTLKKTKTGREANVKLKRLDSKALKKKKPPMDSSSAMIQTSISAPHQVMAPAATEELPTAHLLKFEHQEEYDDDQDLLEQTPPDPPSLPSSSSLSAMSNDKDRVTKKEKCIGKNGQGMMRRRTESDSETKSVTTAALFHRKWECDICKISVFSSPYRLTQHKKTCRDTHQKRLSASKARQSDPRYKFACPTCEKKFRNRSWMLEHNRTVHLKQKNHGCDLCSKTFPTLSTLNVHKNAIHLGITFKCRVCAKEFKYRHTLKEHERKCENKTSIIAL